MVTFLGGEVHLSVITYIVDLMTAVPLASYAVNDGGLEVPTIFLSYSD